MSTKDIFLPAMTLVVALLLVFQAGTQAVPRHEAPEHVVHINGDGDITKYVTASGYTAYEKGWSFFDASITFPVDDGGESHRMTLSLPVDLADGTVATGLVSMDWEFTELREMVLLYNELTDAEDAKSLGYWYSLETATSAAMVDILAENLPIVTLKDTGVLSVKYDPAAAAQFVADQALPGGAPSDQESRYIYDFDCVQHVLDVAFMAGFDRALNERSLYFGSVIFTAEAEEVTTQSVEPCGMYWHDANAPTTPPPGPQEEPTDAELYPSTDA